MVALVVVDDVWRVEDLEPLLAESPRSRLLFTTRDASIAAGVGAREHVADVLTEEQSRDVLVRWSGAVMAKLPPIAADLIRECSDFSITCLFSVGRKSSTPAASTINSL
jgi:hypothetical protein